MNFGDIIKSVLELAAISFTVWGLFHEDRFIAFEDRIAAYFRRRGFKVLRGGACRDTSDAVRKIS